MVEKGSLIHQQKDCGAYRAMRVVQVYTWKNQFMCDHFFPTDDRYSTWFLIVVLLS